jgi:hypothetical protein
VVEEVLKALGARRVSLAMKSSAALKRKVAALHGGAAGTQVISTIATLRESGQESGQLNGQLEQLEQLAKVKWDSDDEPESLSPAQLARNQKMAQQHQQMHAQVLSRYRLCTHVFLVA